MREFSRQSLFLPDRESAGGGEIAFLRWTQLGTSPAAFIHGTGFNAHTYRQFLGHLAGGWDIVAPDMRGHGRSRLETDPSTLYNWYLYAEDIEAFLLSQPQPEAGWRMIGHSMGATSSLLALARGRIKVSHLVLIEPVIVPAIFRFAASPLASSFTRRHMPMSKQAYRRRASWPTRGEALKSYSGKRFFGSWSGGVLEDYLVDGLSDTEFGVELSCAPEWEAATFAAQGHNFWAALNTVQHDRNLRLQIFLAEQHSTTRPFAQKRLEQQGVAMTVLPSTGHLIPQEQPERLADLVSAVLA